MRFVYWVIPQRLAGRPGPTYQPWDPAELYAGGIEAVISLPEELEIEDLTAYGLRHYRFSFPPVLLSSEGMQKAFIYKALPVWKQIDALLKEGVTTLVHCYAGNDRTGAILAGYLVTYQGLEPEQAIRHVRSLNLRAMEAEGYEAAIRRLEPNRLPDPRTLL